MLTLRASALILTFALSAGAARAQAVAAPVIDLTAGQARALPKATAIGVSDGPSTTVDHRFGAGGVMASAGFLCDLQPGVKTNGGPTASEFDPNGRFVGARLSLRFK
ncbi:MAG: hypothetical protein P4L64_08205 [Caulobacteraceae bacterium]|nr:hypothetical protein [Caulobacteraceae bacterium]